MNLRDMSKWESWWFIRGGGIHRAFKYRQWSQLRGIAESLPKAAWDQQQIKIDSLQSDADFYKAEVMKLRASLRIVSDATRLDEAEGPELRAQVANAHIWSTRSIEQHDKRVAERGKE